MYYLGQPWLDLINLILVHTGWLAEQTAGVGYPVEWVLILNRELRWVRTN